MKSTAARCATSSGEVSRPEWLGSTICGAYDQPLRQSASVVPDNLLERWEIVSVGRPYADGAVGFVAPVSRSSGRLAVVKINPPGDSETVFEAEALRLYGGDGAVRLLDYDGATGAMLLERLGTRSLLDEPDAAAAAGLAAHSLRRLSRPIDRTPALPESSDLIDGWQEDIASTLAELCRRCGLRGIDAARAALDRLRAPAELGLANRDAHRANFLAADRARWLLIDPKPVRAERAFDGGHLVRDLMGVPPTLAVGDAIAIVAGGLDVAPTRVRDWALVRAVADVAWSILQDDEPDARRWAGIARALSAS